MTNETASLVADLKARYFAAGVDAARLLCDAHDPARVVFTFIGRDLAATDLSYGELRERSARLASVLAGRGIGPGDHVAVLMGKRPELVVTLLALWRLGAVHVPLFTAFAPPAIDYRLAESGAKLLVVDEDQAPKIASLETTVELLRAEDVDALSSGAEALDTPAAMGPDAPLLLLFTSGTTGRPKGVAVPLRALASIHAYMEFGLDVRDDDVYWNAADPGWAYGLYYAILGPLAVGRRSLLLEGGFSSSLSHAVLAKFGVTNFAAAPTVYRSLRQDGAPGGLCLRCASSAGEPLTPEVIAWAQEALGVEVRDHYGQTEHGMLIVNGWHPAVKAPLEAGSIGRPLPGFVAGIVDGHIAIDMRASELVWFAGYRNRPESTAERFTADGRWYLTGDAGSVRDGQFHFAAREDDIILMAGYRIGPFDVESVLCLHEAVAEVAVVGRPDALRGEVVEAFVVPASGATPSAALVAELQTLVKTRYSAHAYPRKIHFVSTLPKTPSGKIQRYVLRTNPTVENLIEDLSQALERR